MNSKKILIVYVDIGKGHYKSAKAIKEAFEKAGMKAEMEDFMKIVPKPYHIFMKDAYLRVVKYFPQAYNLAYKFTANMDKEEAKVYANIVVFSMYPFIEKMYEKFKPDIVVSTHPITTLSFGHLKEKKVKDLKVVGVITDYHVINFFLAKELNCVSVPHEQVIEEYILENGPSDVELLPYGIPVSQNFSMKMTKQEAKKAVGLENEKNVVLVMAGGLGFAHVVEVAETLSGENFKEPIAIVCLAGKNNNAFEKIREIEKTKPRRNKIYYVDWVEDVSFYMKASSMIISKAGGSTIAEASSLGLPFVVYRPLPGQEYLNTNFLLRNKAALCTNYKEELKILVNKIIFENASKDLSKNILKLAKPNAAFDLVNKINESF